MITCTQLFLSSKNENVSLISTTNGKSISVTSGNKSKTYRIIPQSISVEKIDNILSNELG